MFEIDENSEMQKALDQIERQLYYIKNSAVHRYYIKSAISKIYESLAELENALQE